MFSRSKPKRPNKRLRFESLESRQMMDGGLFAQLVNGTLFINEDHGSLGDDHGVQVIQIPSGVRVSGIESTGGGPTLINGQESVEFDMPLRIVAGLGGGSDTIQIAVPTSLHDIQILAESFSGGPNDNDTVNLIGVGVTGVLDIRTGAGMDTVRLDNVRIISGFQNEQLLISTGVPSAFGEEDKDTIVLNGVTSLGKTTITTGASSDLVQIQNSQFGNTSQDFLEIKSGAGADTVEIGPPAGESGNFQAISGNLVIETFDSESELDADNVRLQQVIAEKNVRVDLGSGNDVVNLLGVSVQRNLRLNGMRGNDTMKLTEVEAIDSLFALMGDGNDVLDLTFVRTNNMTLDGGLGFDRLERRQNAFVPVLTIVNFERINGMVVRKSVPGIDDIALGSP